MSEAESDYDRRMSLSHLYDALTVRDRIEFDPRLNAFASAYGGCPSGWQPLLSSGWFREIPKDGYGNPYGIDPERCSLLAYKTIEEN